MVSSPSWVDIQQELVRVQNASDHTISWAQTHSLSPLPLSLSHTHTHTHVRLSLTVSHTIRSGMKV